MKRVRQFLKLTTAERTVLAQAIPLVAFIRVCLWVVPFDTFRRSWASILAKMTRSKQHEILPPRKIVWLVSLAGRCVPGAHCLTRSVAAQMLLARQGHVAKVQIGVRKQGTSLDAHAWLEYDGHPLLENESHLSRFTPLSAPSSGPETADSGQ